MTALIQKYKIEEQQSDAAEALIAHYILQYHSKALFALPYKDYAVIQQWLISSQHDTDALLSILQELLPEHYAQECSKKNQRTPSLKPLHKKVLKKLIELQHR